MSVTTGPTPTSVPSKPPRTVAAHKEKGVTPPRFWISNPWHKATDRSGIVFPKLRVGRDILSRPVFRVGRCPSGARRRPGLDRIIHPAQTLLVNFLKQNWKPPFGFLPFTTRNLERLASGRLDLGRDGRVNRNSVNQPPPQSVSSTWRAERLYRGKDVCCDRGRRN